MLARAQACALVGVRDAHGSLRTERPRQGAFRSVDHALLGRAECSGLGGASAAVALLTDEWVLVAGTGSVRAVVGSRDRCGVRHGARCSAAACDERRPVERVYARTDARGHSRCNPDVPLRGCGCWVEGTTGAAGAPVAAPAKAVATAQGGLERDDTDGGPLAGRAGRASPHRSVRGGGLAHRRQPRAVGRLRAGAGRAGPATLPVFSPLYQLSAWHA